MEFVFETDYNQRAMTAMAKGLRKTVRKKRSRRTHIFGWIVIALALLLGFVTENSSGTGTLVTWAAAIAMIGTMIFEDFLNGYLARKNMLPGTAHAKAIFTEGGYRSETAAGNTEWKYENIAAMAELPRYFVFLFGKNHAQVYDKRSLTGGTAEDFRAFMEAQTGKTVEILK